MGNKEIAAQFKLLAQLMELHGENSFKTKAYSTAAFRIDKLGFSLAEDQEALAGVPGIGAAIAEKVKVLLETGRFPLLETFLEKTPEGVQEMLALKGIGPKKIALLWKELGVENLGELGYACQENRLISLKGFGAKTQASILESIAFLESNKDWFLYVEAEAQLALIQKDLLLRFPEDRLEVTGAFRRQMPILDELEWVTTIDPIALQDFLQRKLETPGTLEPADRQDASAIQNTSATQEASGSLGAAVSPSASGTAQGSGAMETEVLRFDPPGMIRLAFYPCSDEEVEERLFLTTAPDAFKADFEARYRMPEAASTEADMFTANSLELVPPALWDYPGILELAARKAIPEVVEASAIKGIIHAHSTYSDGVDSLQELAEYVKEAGYEYLVISDHSKSATYAQGLQVEAIVRQHEEIEALNRLLHPFKIFKSIESDILNDGNLDYPDEVLASFDLVIASVHSNLKMTQEKAMARLLRAVENPYTTILGHPTGRLLLSRPGYPIDAAVLIDACAANRVVIEINAHPRRLDFDWSLIPDALEKGVLLSIDPDAHSKKGVDLIKYGVLAAQKGGLTAASNLSSKSLAEFEAWLAERRQR